MKQHVLLAMYLASDATILLLDEPFNGLDPTSVSLFIMCLKEIVYKDKIVILSSHDLYNVEHTCTRILFMKNKSWLRTINVTFLYVNNMITYI